MSAPQSYYVPVDAGKRSSPKSARTFSATSAAWRPRPRPAPFSTKCGKNTTTRATTAGATSLHEGGVVRYGDDGEPQGTAGQPMLNVFQREGVENVVCVVTRYFGGVLLGAGGLTRAYAKVREGTRSMRRARRGCACGLP